MKIINLFLNLYHLLKYKTKLRLILLYLVHIFFLNFFKKKKSKILKKWRNLLKNQKYNFTMNNITQSVHLIEKIKLNYLNRKINIILIGCFEGMSSIFFLNTFNIKNLYCVDIWNKSFYKKSKIKPNINAEKYFDLNTSGFLQIKKFKTSTDLFFKHYNSHKVDIIYLDASHDYLNVYKDAINAWNILKKDGYLIFNSFLYRSNPVHKYNNLIGINLFIKKNNIYFKLISISSNMLILKKK